MLLRQAVLKTQPKQGILVDQIEIPEISPDEVLIKVKAVGICGTDVHIYNWKSSFEYLQEHFPVVLGHEFSGEVVEVGNQVKNVKKGDRVTAEIGISCGDCIFCLTGQSNICELKYNYGRIGLEKKGAMASHVVCHYATLHEIPDSVSFEEAALCEPATVAFSAFEKIKIIPGDTVVIVGIGYIGLILVQLVKAAGANPIIITGLSQDINRLKIAKSVGADEAINIDEIDPVEKVKSMTNGLGASFVFEVSGTESGFNQGLEMLRKGGEFIAVGIYNEELKIDITQKLVREMRVFHGVSGGLRKNWPKVLKLMKTGQLNIKPLITHTFPLKEAEKGFKLCSDKEAIKVILTPED